MRVCVKKLSQMEYGKKLRGGEAEGDSKLGGRKAAGIRSDGPVIKFGDPKAIQVGPRPCWTKYAQASRQRTELTHRRTRPLHHEEIGYQYRYR